MTTTNFNDTPHTVVHRDGKQVAVQTPEDVDYKQNTSREFVCQSSVHSSGTTC